ncbi:MAG: TIGR03619 family F420-dependent LLM class oxidoreductase [Dehalococcoidia bacterium]|jgi:probable F420-dependent oxidoreductase|nr:TIGR03619 family F420-dependent LLM class oxidoreductase [Dehalococcoidia bacterium]
MEFGFGVAMRGPAAAPEFLERQVKHGEELGLDIVTVSDHVIIPKAVGSIYPYSEDGAFSGGDAGECLEQLTVAMFLAAHTSSIRVLTSVMVLPHRPPVLAAKILASLDVLSGGRLLVGVGAGWMREEFEALGTAPYEHRGSVANDYIRAFKEMWTSDSPEYNGAYAQVSDVSFYPKPVQDPHPPIWVGGESPPALRRAGQLGDAWYPIGSNPTFPMDTPELLAEAMATVRRHAEEAGRDPESIDFGYSAGWYDDGEEKTGRSGERLIFTGNPEQVASDIREFEALGVRHLVIGLTGQTPDGTLNRMERFATEVRPLTK